VTVAELSLLEGARTNNVEQVLAALRTHKVNVNVSNNVQLYRIILSTQYSVLSTRYCTPTLHLSQWFHSLTQLAHCTPITVWQS